MIHGDQLLSAFRLETKTLVMLHTKHTSKCKVTTPCNTGMELVHIYMKALSNDCTAMVQCGRRELIRQCNLRLRALWTDSLNLPFALCARMQKPPTTYYCIMFQNNHVIATVLGMQPTVQLPSFRILEPAWGSHSHDIQLCLLMSCNNSATLALFGILCKIGRHSKLDSFTRNL